MTVVAANDDGKTCENGAIHPSGGEQNDTSSLTSILTLSPPSNIPLMSPSFPITRAPTSPIARPPIYTNFPSLIASNHPSSAPSKAPGVTFQPSILSLDGPSRSVKPSSRPTNVPPRWPSSRPSLEPSMIPSMSSVPSLQGQTPVKDRCFVNVEVHCESSWDERGCDSTVPVKSWCEEIPSVFTRATKQCVQIQKRRYFASRISDLQYEKKIYSFI